LIKHAFDPIRINQLEVPNRVVRTAHGTHFGNGINDKLIAYHAARAKGGVGLTILEIASVHRTSPSHVCNHDDSIIDGYEKLMAAVRPYGMRIFQQLWHGGHNRGPGDGKPPWSASDIPSAYTGEVPIEMSVDQIREIVNAYALAAVRCKTGGLDGVEVHAAHSYLVQQFLSPLTNKRTDEYGGSFDNRFRFLREVMSAIRAKTGRDFPIGVRLSSEMTPGGLMAEENIQIARQLESEELIDFLDVSMGGYYSFADMIGGMHEPAGYELPESSPVTAAVDVPCIVTGRFRTIEEIDQVIHDGIADLVGMTRAHIADPDIVKKTKEGRVEEVRPCIGCNHGCVGQSLIPGKTVGCTVNPFAGREAEFSEDSIPAAPVSKSILVVGGGPAGLEAARIASLRGHRVMLAEADKSLGGQVRFAALAPTRHGIKDIITWLESEVYRLGVDVQHNTFILADDIKELAPDHVIIATGSQPRLDGMQKGLPGMPVDSAGLAHVMSSIDLLTGAEGKNASAAVVVDDTGHYEAIAAAEFLIARGASVDFVTPLASFAPVLESSLSPSPALQRLHKGQFRVHARSHLKSVTADSVEILGLQSQQVESVNADCVVLVSSNRPFQPIEPDKDLPPMVVIGDALSPRYLLSAIEEGSAAGMSA